MSIEQGVVKEIAGEKILVISDPKSACVSCEVKHSCVVSASEKKRKIWMENSIGALEGNTIEFTITAKGVVMSSFLIYLFPPVMLIIGILIGEKIPLLNIPQELNSALTGVILFFLAFLIIRPISEYLKKKNDFKPQALKIIN